MTDTVIHSARMVDGGRTVYDAWIAVDADGMISAVGSGDGWPRDGRETVDAAGMLLMPGVIDTHVHFREPGMTRKADFASESLAAAAGGVTSVIDMPNTSPATVTLEAWEDKMVMGAAKSAVNYAFFIGATNHNLDTLMGADYTRVAGIKLFLGSSTGDMLVDSRPMLERLFAQAPALIAVHAESESLIKEGRREALEKFGDGPVPISWHRMIRSRQACVESSKVAVELARRHGARVHLCHISTADELSLLDGTAPVTAETAPHYLWFDSADYERLGARVKCNPAIKEVSDRDALRRAVATGLIDTVATDHAPHMPADKEGDALHAASGMPGIDMSLRVMLELASQGVFTYERVVDAMCARPAEIFGIDRRGRLLPGHYADMVLLNYDQEASPVTDADTLTRCGWTPYAGSTLHWQVERTMVNGRWVYKRGAAPQRIEDAAMPLRFAGKG